jgi:hypothetical protein
MKKLFLLLAIIVLTVNSYTQTPPTYFAPKLVVYINGVSPTASDSVTILADYTNTILGHSGVEFITFTKIYNVDSIIVVNHLNCKKKGCSPLIGEVTCEYDQSTRIFRTFKFRFFNIKNPTVSLKKDVYMIKLDYTFNNAFNSNEYITRIYLKPANTPHKNGYNAAKLTCGK